MALVSRGASTGSLQGAGTSECGGDLGWDPTPWALCPGWTFQPPGQGLAGPWTHALYNFSPLPGRPAGVLWGAQLPRIPMCDRALGQTRAPQYAQALLDKQDPLTRGQEVPAGRLHWAQGRSWSTHHVLAVTREGLLDIERAHGALHVAVDIADALPPANLLHRRAIECLAWFMSSSRLPKPTSLASAPGCPGTSGVHGGTQTLPLNPDPQGWEDSVWFGGWGSRHRLAHGGRGPSLSPVPGLIICSPGVQPHPKHRVALTLEALSSSTVSCQLPGAPFSHLHSDDENACGPWGHGTAHQVPLSMGFSWQEYWSGLPFPSPGESS